jgi:phytoene synthase
MNGDLDPENALAPLPMLLLAYAPAAQRPWQRLCWQLDQRLGAVVRRAGDPMVAAIRLAWWDAVLVEGDREKGGGEPLVEQWRQIAPVQAAPAAEALIDGWRQLLSAEPMGPEELAWYGTRRGGGLFALLGQGALSAETDKAGAVWALWDLAGHASDAALAQAAIAAAGDPARAGAVVPRALKPLRLLHDLARRDALAGRVPEGGFSARHYRRLLWRALVG